MNEWRKGDQSLAHQRRELAQQRHAGRDGAQILPEVEIGNHQDVLVEHGIHPLAACATDMPLVELKPVARRVL